MKKLLLVVPLLLTPSCASAREALGLDGEPTAEGVGQGAGTAATAITGNPLIGAGVGTIVTAIAAVFIAKRKKKPAAT